MNKISIFAQNIIGDILCIMKYNIKEATDYISEFLGFEADAVGVTSSELKRVPIALTTNYSFFNVVLLEQAVVFACAKKPEDCSPVQLAKHQELLRNLFQRTVIFVLAQIESYNLTRLTRARVNFIVPGKIIFVPSMMMLLRNVNVNKREERETMPPVSQLLVLYHLQKRKLDGMDASRLAELTGMAYSTIIKAINWLSTNQIVTLSEGKQKFVQFAADGRSLWVKTLPLMTSPVERTLFSDADLIDASKAGESAMGEYTMLAEPVTPVVAVSKNFAQQNRQQLDSKHGVTQVQVWCYNPALLADGVNVDRLSLYLSMKDSADERVQMECDTLINEMKW